jgi:hypothetical protein
MACSNKQKQLALAMHNYADANNSEMPWNGDNYGYPIGLPTPIGSAALRSQQQISVWVWLLPFIEQSGLYSNWMEVYDALPAVTSQTFADTDKYFGHCVCNPHGYPRQGWCAPYSWYPAELLDVDVDFLGCPSDNNTNKSMLDTVSNRNQRGGSYVVSSGDWCLKNEYSSSGAAAAGTPAAIGWARGVIQCLRKKPFAEIVDGTSNTVLLSERCVSDSASFTSVDGKAGSDYGGTASRNYRTNIVIEDATSDGGQSAATSPYVFRGQGGSSASDRGTLSGAKSSSDWFYPANALNTIEGGQYLSKFTAIWSSGGTQWYSSCNRMTWCNTILPPNSPSVGSRDVRSYGTALLPPTSYHTGGANTALADGTVHFIPDTIYCGTYATYTSYNGDPKNSNGCWCRVEGESPFGVWGALGAADDGTAVSVP